MQNKENEKKIILCVDTSTQAASVAIGEFNDNNNIHIKFNAFLNDGRTHSQKIVPMINTALSFCNLSLENVDLFSVINGPGSFTGLRIGVSTIKAFADSLNKPVVVINTLEALAYSVNHFDGIIVPMLDARRQNVFTAIFDNTQSFKKIVDDKLLSIDILIKKVKEINKKVCFLGCGATKNKENIINLIDSNFCFANEFTNYQRADVAIELAVSKYLFGDFLTGNNVLPNYIKGTSAKPQVKI